MMNAKFSNSYDSYQRHQQPYISRVHPQHLIQSITAAKILQEQQAARASPVQFGLGIQRMDPEFLIQKVTESKMAQKRLATKLAVEKKQKVRPMKRTVRPLDFSKLNENSVLELTEFMAALPASYEKKFRYGDLTKPVPVPHCGVYSNDHILTIGAQLEMAKFRAEESIGKNG